MLPLRNVIFDDDFAYVRTVQHLVSTGTLKISEWTAATSIFPSYWGAFFFKLFGNSIVSLHISNIVIFYLGLISFFLILLELGVSKKASTIYSILYMSSLWVFHFIFTFMTDIGYISLVLMASLFYIKGVQTNKIRLFATGSLLAGLAFLTRQTGIILPVAISFVLLVQLVTNKKYKKTFWEIVAACIPFFVIYAAYQLWLGKTGMTASQYNNVYIPVKSGLLPYIIPSQNSSIYASNSVYKELFIQRAAGYMVTGLPILIPALLLYKISFKQIFSFLKSNIKGVTLFSLLITTIFLGDKAFGNKFSRQTPNLLFTHFPAFDLQNIWPILAIIAIPVFTIFIGGSIQNVIRKFLVPYKNSVFARKAFKISILVWFVVLFILIVLSKDFNKIPSFMSHPGARLLDPFIVNSYIGFFSKAWSFIAFFLIFTIFASYLVTHYKFRRLKLTQLSVVFLSISLMAHFLVTLIFANFFWQEYLIPFIPLSLSLVAYSFRKNEIMIVKSVLIVLAVATLSIQTARNKYQILGVKWETSEKFVKQGVDPYDINQDAWGWRPYWYFDNTFEEAAKIAGDKYKVFPISQWKQGKVHDMEYEVEVLDANSVSNKNIMYESDKFWVFWKFKKVLVFKPEKN